MAIKIGFSVLLLMGFFCLIAAMMWDSGVNSAWIDINNSTEPTGHTQAATQSGLIFGGGFGIALAGIGILLVVGAIIMLIRDISGSGGR
jgi:hypothetical protein